jgi:4-coumarate--CoA ligase (photoactive yellow protein activation family)
MTSQLPAVLGRHAPGDPVLWGDRVIDAATLRSRAIRTASRLPGGEGAVLISCSETVSFVIAVLAAWRRGLAIALPPNTRARTLDEIRGKASICTQLGDGDARLLSEPGADEPPDDGAPIMPSGLAPDRHLATVYTSGSTGPYEIVHKSAAQLLGEAAMLATTFGLDQRVRSLSTVPPHHIYGLLFGVLVPLTCGGSIIAGLPLHASAVEAVAREHQATVLVSTPAHLRGLEVLEVGAVPSVDRVFSSGAPLHPSTASKVRDRFDCDVTEILGSTETGGIAWRSADGGQDVPWRPLPGVRVGSSDDGQLLLWSPFLPADAPRPFAAEDRIVLLDADEGRSDDVRFRHLGRIDDVVKVGGKRISLGVLESRLRSLPAVRDAAVLADEAPDGHDRRLRAAVVAPEADPETLRGMLLQWFDPVVVPRRIVLVDELPREATGKLRRSALKRLLDVERGDPRRRPTELVLRRLSSEREDERRFEVDVPPNLVHFEGHFPGNPILSGVALLEAAGVRPSQQAWPELGGLRQVHRLKFKQPIGPGDRLELRLCRDGERVFVELHRDDEPCASATLVFAVAP